METLAEMLEQYRRGERGLPTYAELAGLVEGNGAATSASAQQAEPVASDRAMLEAVSKDLEISSWECPRCGHGEDCKTMDAAMMLRDYLAAPAPKDES